MLYGMRSFIDSIPFWIGGSVNADPNDHLTSADIIANNSGTIIIRSHLKYVAKQGSQLALYRADLYISFKFLLLI